MPQLYVAFGSNMGDRAEHIRTAALMLSRQTDSPCHMSPLIENKAVGFHTEHHFLNSVARYDTTLPLATLLDITQGIERTLGRTIKSQGGAYTDRPIDIDLLLYGSETLHSPRITLPHPRLHERLFVLYPLAAIAPTLVHPTIGKDIDTLLAELIERTPATDRPEALVRLTPHDATESTAADLRPLLAALSSKTHPVSAHTLQILLAAPHVHIYILRRFGIACGMFTLIENPALSGRKIWIEDVAVLPSMQGQGLGRKLMTHAIAQAKALGGRAYLTSRPSRTAANALYRKMGFQQRETNVYAYPEE